MKAKLIVVLTETGTSARLIAKYRPNVPVYVVTPSEATARQCNGYLKNCEAFTSTTSTVPSGPTKTDLDIQSAIDTAKSKGAVKSGDPVVCVFGSREGGAGSVYGIEIHGIPHGNNYFVKALLQDNARAIALEIEELSKTICRVDPHCGSAVTYYSI